MGKLSKDNAIKIAIYSAAAMAVYLAGNAFDKSYHDCYGCYDGGIYYAGLFVLICFFAEFVFGKYKFFRIVMDFLTGFLVATGMILYGAKIIIDSQPGYVPNFGAGFLNLLSILTISAVCFIFFKKSKYEKFFLGTLTGSLFLPAAIIISAFIGL